MTVVLDDELRAAFLALATERRHGGGAQLIAECSFDGPALLLEGKVDILRHTSDGRVVVFDQVSGMRFLGLHASITGGAHDTAALARSAGRAAFTSRSVFRRLLGHPSHATEIMRILADDARCLTNRFFEFSTLQMRDRLIVELLRCFDEAAKHGPQRASTNRLSPAPTQSDLAARIAAQREAVSREMNRLRRLGLVLRQGRELVLPSRVALATALSAAVLHT